MATIRKWQECRHVCGPGIQLWVCHAFTNALPLPDTPCVSTPAPPQAPGETFPTFPREAGSLCQVLWPFSSIPFSYMNQEHSTIGISLGAGHSEWHWESICLPSEVVLFLVSSSPKPACVCKDLWSPCLQAGEDNEMLNLTQSFLLSGAFPLPSCL